MKTIIKTIGIIIFLGHGVVVSAQAMLSAFPGTITILANTDVTSTGLLTAANAEISTRIGSLGTIATMAGLSNTELNKVIKKKYDKTSYDKSSAFLGSLKTGAMALGTNIMASRFSNGYYMTKNKQEYIRNIGLQKAALLSIQHLDYNSLTTADRQEIYRLRNEIIKEFSLNDREVIKQLLLPAVKYSVEVAPELARIIKAMELIE